MPRTATSSIYSKTLGQEIRAARKSLGLTQAQVAERMGVTPIYITNVEAGRVNLTVGQLAHIAASMGVGLEIKLPIVEREPVTV